jgi:hypothetical protein
MARLASPLPALVRQFDYGTDNQPEPAAKQQVHRGSPSRPLVNGGAQQQEALSIH